jgi:hypothetical protein
VVFDCWHLPPRVQESPTSKTLPAQSHPVYTCLRFHLSQLSLPGLDPSCCHYHIQFGEVFTAVMVLGCHLFHGQDTGKNFYCTYFSKDI